MRALSRRRYIVVPRRANVLKQRFGVYIIRKCVKTLMNKYAHVGTRRSFRGGRECTRDRVAMSERGALCVRSGVYVRRVCAVTDRHEFNVGRL